MILCADSQQVPLENHIAQLVYVDPPYNTDYNKCTTLSNISYEDLMFHCIGSGFKLMSYESRMVICIGRPPTSYQLETLVVDILKRLPPDYSLEQELIWYFTFGKYTQRHFVPSHERILVIKRGNPSFNWQAIAVESQRLRVGDPRGDPRGKTPDSVLSIARVPGNSKERRFSEGDHRSIQPEALCRLFVKAFTRPSDLIVDLFTGSGTMCVVANNNGRRYIGIDINETYCKEAANRVENGWKGKI